MTGLEITIIAISVILGLVGFSQKDNMFGNICFVLTAIGLIVVSISRNTQPVNSAFIAKENGYFASQATRINKNLNKNNISGNVTLLVYPKTKKQSNIQAFTKELCKNKNIKLNEIIELSLDENDHEFNSNQLDIVDFQDKIEATSDKEIIISLAGLPTNFKSLDFLNKPLNGNKTLILSCEEVYPTKEQLINGAVFSIIMPSKHPHYSKEKVTDYAKAFDERYTYVCLKK